jgi:uncharacterized protein GlcG (DUF336 family)
VTHVPYVDQPPAPPYGPPLSLADALRIASAAESAARERGWPVVVAIYDSTGHLALLHRMDDAHLASVAVAQQKAETAVKYRRSTRAFEEGIEQGGAGVRAVTLPMVCAVDGGFPLLRNGRIVGSIGVSGMNPTQDAFIAQSGAAALHAPSGSSGEA